jgi:myosin-5
MTDQHVYIRHKDFAWIPAQLIDQDNNKKTATVTHLDYTSESQINADASSSVSTSSSRPPKHSKTVTVQLKDYPNGSLPLQNVVDNRIKVVADMIELSFLHEAAILYNLKARHVQSMPYTRTSDIVIAVNPYQWITSLYTEQNRTRYSRALVWEAAMKEYDPRQDLPPHVYETSALSYKGLSQTGIDQSILVSGESGAGKTETVKICMNHLASVVQQEHTQEGNLDEQDQTVIKRVLDSNPLLEAFGNAKTRRNDNSSRFGKYIQLQFQKGQHNPQHLTLMGSECQVYLLEKSRVTRHDSEERTFHIFYQLLSSPDKIKTKFWSGLKGKTNADFKYVGSTDTTTIEGMSDAEQFEHTLQSLAIIGIEGQVLTSFFQAICVVLQLGNLTFGPPSNGDTDKSVCTSPNELNSVASLMGIPPQILATCLTQRAVKVRGETTLVPLLLDAAKDSTDALAKQLYDRVFLWLVKKINQATSTTMTDTRRYGIIGLLDIFGFESFPVNSFEQLCINYANEQLQQKFTKDVFIRCV